MGFWGSIWEGMKSAGGWAIDNAANIPTLITASKNEDDKTRT